MGYNELHLYEVSSLFWLIFSSIFGSDQNDVYVITNSLLQFYIDRFLINNCEL